jgi:hypothetical protein
MSATDRPFINNATQRERREIVKNERKLRQGERQSTTYHAQAMAGLDEPGGRFANQARYVTGSEAAVNYPASSPPWHAQADPGIEPPTGVAIDTMEPTGEAHEIEASLAASSSDSALSQRVRSAASVGDDGAASHDLAEDECSSGPITPAAVAPTLAVSSPASSERGPRPSSSTKLRRKLK